MNTKTLSAARRRRDEGERPLPLDYVWLAGEKPNRKQVQEPKWPTPSALEGRVLDLLRERPLPAADLAAKVRASETEVRAAINVLRNELAWPIVNVAGHFAVVNVARCALSLRPRARRPRAGASLSQRR